MIGLFKQFLDRIKFEGLSPFGRFYGIWKGKVLATMDNDNQGKIQVAVPEVSGSETVGVANPAYPLDPIFASFPPKVGDWVWVFFEQGDPRFPVYIGHWWAKNERPASLNPDPNTAPTKRFFVTESGHQLVFEDKTGSEEITILHKAGAFVKLLANGTIEIDAGTNEVHVGRTEVGGSPNPVLDNIATGLSLDFVVGHKHLTSQGLTTGALGPDQVPITEPDTHTPQLVTTQVKGT